MQRYTLPIRVDWVRFDRERYNPIALAAVRQAAREGTLFDVATDKEFIELLLDNVRHSRTTTNGVDKLVFQPTAKLLQEPEVKIEHVHAVETEQSNSTSLVDESFVVKLYRRIEAGINPEIEMGRFLTDVVGFANTPDLLGSVELVEGDRRSAVAIIHRLIPNQGDAWSVAASYLDRFVEERRLLSAEEKKSESSEQINSLRYMTQIGKRVAEMQMALASRPDTPDFAPEPATANDLKKWHENFNAGVARVFEALQQHRVSARESDRKLIDALLHYQDDLPVLADSFLTEPQLILKARHHGDLHLGQLLIAKDDILIIDFEGEPRRSLAERRCKAPAARDVAGLLRSIDYAAGAAMMRARAAVPDDGSSTLFSDLETWRDIAAETFLFAYRENLTDTRLWPQDSLAAERLLKFFLLEKVFYEIEYELAHRPDWLSVPLDGALRILASETEVDT